MATNLCLGQSWTHCSHAAAREHSSTASLGLPGRQYRLLPQAATPKVRGGILGGHGSCDHPADAGAIQTGRPVGTPGLIRRGVLFNPRCESCVEAVHLFTVSYTHLRAHETVLDLV